MMKLIGTPRSHFTRKVRLLLDHLEQPYHFVDVADVTLKDKDIFASNPVLSVPVLEDGEVWLIESDHITRYIAQKFDTEDRFRTLRDDPIHLNFRAVLNGAMDNEVKLVLSKRMGLDPQGIAYFDKARATLDECLSWLEVRRDHFDMTSPGDLEFHLVCLWQHLRYFSRLDLPDLEIGRMSADLAKRAVFRKSALPEELV